MSEKSPKTINHFPTPEQWAEALRLAKLAESGDKPEDAHSIQYAKGVLLVEPVNSDPYVFDLYTGWLHTFKSEPGSGTDHLRQRIQADLFAQDLGCKRQDGCVYLDLDSARDNMEELDVVLDEVLVRVGVCKISKGYESYDVTNPFVWGSSGEDLDEALFRIETYETTGEFRLKPAIERPGA